jgi:N utilization substance protein A
MNTELIEALEVIEREKNISKDAIFDAIVNSIYTACKNRFGKSDNIRVEIDHTTGDYKVWADKEVVEVEEDIEDDILQIALEDAKKIDPNAKIGDTVAIDIDSKEFGRIATQNAKNVILQKIREEERNVIYNEYKTKEKEIVTGIVQRFFGKNILVNLGRADAMLKEADQVKGER